jgi:hypothetical protein
MRGREMEFCCHDPLPDDWICLSALWSHAEDHLVSILPLNVEDWARVGR